MCLTWCLEDLTDPHDSEQPDSTAAEPLEGPPGPRRCSHSSAGRISTETHTCCSLVHTSVVKKKKKKSERTTVESSDLPLKLCPTNKCQSHAGSVSQPRDPDSELGCFAPRNLRVKHSKPAPGTSLCRHVRSLKGREQIPQ